MKAKPKGIFSSFLFYLLEQSVVEPKQSQEQFVRVIVEASTDDKGK